MKSSRHFRGHSALTSSEVSHDISHVTDPWVFGLAFEGEGVLENIC